MNKCIIDYKLIKRSHLIRIIMDHFKQLAKSSRTIRFDIDSLAYQMLRIRDTVTSLILLWSTLCTSHRKMNVRTKQIFKVKFKGGRFALKAEKLLQEITEEYFRNKTGMPFVDNESRLFEEVMEKFVESFVGDQTSALNYIALVDVFHKENNAQLRELGKLITVNEETRSLEFSDKLLQTADPSLTVTEDEQQ